MEKCTLNSFKELENVLNRLFSNFVYEINFPASYILCQVLAQGDVLRLCYKIFDYARGNYNRNAWRYFNGASIIYLLIIYMPKILNCGF